MNRRLKEELSEKNNKIKEIDEKYELIINSSLDAENKNSVQKQLMLMKIKINNEISEIKKQPRLWNQLYHCNLISLLQMLLFRR